VVKLAFDPGGAERRKR